MDALYTAIAHASGGGRDGHVRSEDDRLDFDTRPPVEMGGSGEGTNPEQLFAAVTPRASSAPCTPLVAS
jgi:osmotically inducible protein OsmC